MRLGNGDLGELRIEVDGRTAVVAPVFWLPRPSRLVAQLRTWLAAHPASDDTAKSAVTSRGRVFTPGRGAPVAPPAARHTRAWLVLTGALALHVVDEAVTDFLGFYNPLVLAIRSRAWWFPMPTFTFAVWIAGLAAAVALLTALAPAVRRGARGTRAASWVLSGIMCANGLGHLAGSLYFQRWLPGTTSAPLLLIASVLLARRTWDRTPRRSGDDT